MNVSHPGPRFLPKDAGDTFPKKLWDLAASPQLTSSPAREPRASSHSNFCCYQTARLYHERTKNAGRLFWLFLVINAKCLLLKVIIQLAQLNGQPIPIWDYNWVGTAAVMANSWTVPLFAEEKIVTMIFSECDTEGSGKVPVLKLMHFMLSQADQKLDRWEGI